MLKLPLYICINVLKYLVAIYIGNTYDKMLNDNITKVWICMFLSVKRRFVLKPTERSFTRNSSLLEKRIQSTTVQEAIIPLAKKNY